MKTELEPANPENSGKCASSDKQKEDEAELTFKERIKGLDEKKRKAFVNYKWWEHGLSNSKNVEFTQVH